MLSYRYISFKVDWYLVSSQLYFTINLEEIFYFNDKKYHIYAVFSVSQTPTKLYEQKESKIVKVSLPCFPLYPETKLNQPDLDEILNSRSDLYDVK